MGQTGQEECGLEWGGGWTTLVDLPHFQLPTGMSVADCLDLYSGDGGGLQAVWEEATRRLQA